MNARSNSLALVVEKLAEETVECRCGLSPDFTRRMLRPDAVWAAIVPLFKIGKKTVTRQNSDRVNPEREKTLGRAR